MDLNTKEIRQAREDYYQECLKDGYTEETAKFLGGLYLTDTGRSIVSDPKVYVATHPETLLAFMEVVSPGVFNDFMDAYRNSFEKK